MNTLTVSEKGEKVVLPSSVMTLCSKVNIPCQLPVLFILFFLYKHCLFILRLPNLQNMYSTSLICVILKEHLMLKIHNHTHTHARYCTF